MFHGSHKEGKYVILKYGCMYNEFMSLEYVFANKFNTVFTHVGPNQHTLKNQIMNL